MRPEEWPIASHLSGREADLLHPLPPVGIIEKLEAEGNDAAARHAVELRWTESCEAPGHMRIEAKIPIKPSTFDQLFNSRSGYRAQFYLSPEEGVFFNRDVILALGSAVRATLSQSHLAASWELVEASLLGPHSKIWIFDEKAAFDQAIENGLSPNRWVKNGASRGRKAPLPLECAIDLKGVFVHLATRNIWVSELKLDRACDLFEKGYS